VRGKGSIASHPVKYQQQAARINVSADKADRSDNATAAGTVFLLIVARLMMRRCHPRAQAGRGAGLSA
jgi:hypothetical protein